MKLIDISGLAAAAAQFAHERDWHKYHSPKNLAMALSVEAAELVEIFQWSTEEESRAVMQSDEADHVRQELADIAIYLVQLCNVMKIDLNAAVEAKIEMNARKYPRPDPSQS
ncbi:dCTP diphosphatase [Pararobbsia alpina]|uniref:nucleotide pyrophosphohydrolase n=1 Tax=Pararobbsia alpina TaxID=621374 RepID=UPI0039A6387C